ncbi:condensation domain-containing protein, partial [Streptomyces sp. V4-01]|nr:condensation domain-containing protein [Streptomyces sp. V4-01]
MTESAERPSPLSAAQLGFWYAQALAPGSRYDVVAEYLDIRGHVDPDLMQAACCQAIDETNTLRSRIAADGPAPRQTLISRLDFEIPMVDLTGAADPEAEAHAWMQADARRPVDIRDFPLFRFALLRLGPRRHFWYQRFHHAAMDGYATTLFRDWLGVLYTALANGTRPPEHDMVQLAELVAEEETYRASPAFADDRAYWQARFPDGITRTSLSAQPPTGPRQEFIREDGRLPRALLGELRAAARGMRTSWSAVLVAAVAVYTHALTGTEEFTLGLPVSGRRTPAARRGLAAMSNLLPLRMRVTPGATVAELVRQATAEIRGALRHQRYRYEDLRRDLRAVDDTGLFGPFVNIINFATDPRFGEHTATTHVLTYGAVEDFSIAVCEWDDDSDFGFSVYANPALHTPEEVRRHLDRLIQVIGRVAAAGHTAKVASIAVLTDRELHEVPSLSAGAPSVGAPSVGGVSVGAPSVGGVSGGVASAGGVSGGG